MRGSIRRRGEQSWEVRIYLGRDPDTGRKRYLTRTIRGTRAEADEACSRLLLEVGAGHHLGDDITVGELLDRWLEHNRTRLSPSTIRDYRCVIDTHLRPTFGATPLRKLRAADLDRHYARMTVGPARVRRAHNVMRRALRQAVRWELVATNVALSADPPPVIEAELHPPDADQVRALLDSAAERDPDLVAYITLAAATGARRGELVALRWSDLDLDRRELVIARALVDAGNRVIVEKDTKTHQVRRIALDAGTVSALRAHRRRLRERAMAVGVRLVDDARVFPLDHEGSTPWRPDTATRRFRSVAVAAGVTGVRLHDLRHFVATQLLAAGVDVRTVSGRLGHRRATMTLDRYAGWVPANDQQAAEILGGILGGA